MKCNICPRKCNIDRSVQKGFCSVDDKVVVARADLHMWEEPCISGAHGSGTIFFTGCNLKCIFCQNHEISGNNTTDSTIGKEVSIERLADLMLELEYKGANNINLVTAAHYVDRVREAVMNAKTKGLNIPIVYNTSSYETVDAIRSLEGLVDVYLPDFKYFDNELAIKFSRAPLYKEVATAAIDEMVKQVGMQQYNEKGLIQSGVIVRHLILPGHTKDSINILDYLHERYGVNISISVMSQYTPITHIEEYPELNRKLTKREYDKVCKHAIDIGIENGYFQEGDVALESFIPSFDFEG